MNLIEDTWIPVIRNDGARETIAPWQITETDNPVIELDAPRPDFQGGLYQFLIGLLQTASAPEDANHWLDLYDEPPTPEELKAAFSQLSPSFELISPDGVAFLQDYDLPEADSKPIAALLIEAPGDKTCGDNLDHFIKGGQVNGICEACAATALFTLQTNAPSGGQGHRVGLRGGGPLTTLLVPDEADATLWQKLWLNVLDQQAFGKQPQKIDQHILPWVGPTRLSDKTGAATGPDDGHPLQQFWGMPRRIRLEAPQDHGPCQLCGVEDRPLIEHFRTRNYGVNYTEHWIHPLTPYRFDPKMKNPPLTIKGQQGGLGYRHWIGLALQADGNGNTPAKVVQEYRRNRATLLDKQGRIARLWCFGFDMDNMKARCWYDYRFPLFFLPPEQLDRLLVWSGQMLELAMLVVKDLRQQVKAAWFERPKDARGNTSFVEAEFWQQTETTFFDLLKILSQQPPETRDPPPEIYRRWLQVVELKLFEVFDRWVLEGNPEDLNMKRIMTARGQLNRLMYGNKTVKGFRAQASEKKESA